MKMHLFVVYIGGTHQRSLIELHDIRFVVGNTIEETYETLRQSWWGTPESLHLDAWGILNYADGYGISVGEAIIKETEHKLYFVNLGGYDQNKFTELHKNIFVVAADEHQAKQKALQQINEWESPHRDYLHQVDSLINLNILLVNHGMYIHLQKEIEEKPFEFTCRYVPIGK
jgi:hypothetical protein